MATTRRKSAANHAAANNANDNAQATLDAARDQNAMVAHEQERVGTKRRAAAPAPADESPDQPYDIEALKKHLLRLATKAANIDENPAPAPISTAPATAAIDLTNSIAAQPDPASSSQFRESIAEARMDVKVNDAPNEAGAFSQQLQVTDGTVTLAKLAKLCLKHKDFAMLGRVLDALYNREAWYLTCLRHLGTDRAHGLQATYEAWRTRRHNFWQPDFDPTTYDKSMGDAILSALRKEGSSAQPRFTNPGRSGSAHDYRSSRDDRQSDRRHYK